MVPTAAISLLTLTVRRHIFHGQSVSLQVLNMVKGAKKGGRVRDKWRDKQWVVVNSPSAFGGTPLNYIPITDPAQAYEAMSRVAQQAEELDFYSIWLYDHKSDVQRVLAIAPSRQPRPRRGPSSLLKSANV